MSSARQSLAAALATRPVALPRASASTRWALVGLALVTAFLYRDALFAGRVIFRRDVSIVWLPQVEALVRAVSAGSWPLWDPFSGFGRPLLADPRAGVLYPPTWLNFVLPPQVFYTWYVAGHLLFSGLGLFLLARRWRVSALGAFTAAGLWMASGPFFSLSLMWHHMAGAAWIPWLFLALDRVLDSGARGALLLAGATLALQIFAGSPDLTALTLLALGAYVVARRTPWRRAASATRGAGARGALIALAFGLLLAAPQWLSTLEWTRRSQRAELPYAEAASWSQHPAGLVLETLLPLRFDGLPLRPETLTWLYGAREPWLFSIHLGAAGAVLACLGACARRPRRGFLLGLLLVSLTFALGRHTPLHAVALTLVPPLRLLRFPVKALVLSSLAWSLLAGFGIDLWTGRDGTPDGRRRRLRVVLAALAALVTLAAAGAATWGAEQLAGAYLQRGPFASLRDATASLAWQLALHALAALVVLWLALRRRLARAGAALLALLALLAPLARHAHMRWDAPRELWTFRPRLLEPLAPGPLTRVYVYDYDYGIVSPLQLRHNPGAATSYALARLPRGWDATAGLFLGALLYLNPPTATRWGLAGSFDRDILGFDAPELAALNVLLREAEARPTHLRLLRLAAVDYAVALTPGVWWRDLVRVADVNEVFERPIRLMRVPAPLPRAFVVGGTRVAEGPAALLALDAPDFDPTREVLLERDKPRAAPAHFAGRARVTAWRPDHVRVETHLNAPGHLVLADAYDPGWRVQVDGREAAPLLRANVAFRAVALPPGRHEVEFVYRPWSVSAGFALAGLGLCAALLATGLGWRRAGALSPTSAWPRRSGAGSPRS